MKTTYLVLAVLGAVIPYAFFIPFFVAEGASLPRFVSALFVNGPAGGFAVDLVFTSLVFWLYMVMQQREHRAPRPYAFMVLNLLIGLSCAFPAYLYARERVRDGTG